jgi:hypothetical protein
MERTGSLMRGSEITIRVFRPTLAAFLTPKPFRFAIFFDKPLCAQCGNL